MEATAQAPLVEALVLRVLPAGVRCAGLDGARLTYRRHLRVVPGQRLSIAAERRWTWRRTPMVGGRLISVSFSLRAIEAAGFALPRATAAGLSCPADGDDRVREALDALADGGWAIARALLLDVLEEQPACLVAHAHLGEVAAALEHREEALAHLSAAVRLGMGAVSGCSPPLRSRRTEAAWLMALRRRADLLARMEQPEPAALDRRRADEWDPREDGCRVLSASGS